MINKTSTVFIAALISILGLTGCVRYNVAEPLNRFSSPEMGPAPRKMRKRHCYSIPTGRQAMKWPSGTEPSTAHVKAAASPLYVTSTVRWLKTENGSTSKLPYAGITYRLP